jgi:hypothetical protein
VDSAFSIRYHSGKDCLYDCYHSSRHRLCSVYANLSGLHGGHATPAWWSRTANYGLIYHGDELDMHAYSDSDWATCPVTRRSISGTVVFMCGAPVSWMSRRQQIVATFSMEAEYRRLLRSTGHRLVQSPA